MIADLEQLSRLRTSLWPESTIQEHAQELSLILQGRPPSVMPLVELVAEQGDGTLVGFVEVGLRSYADECDASRPVGYLEGLYVDPGLRRTGIGARLVAAAEQWAREQGCVEMASDSEIGNDVSQRTHEALGYAVTSRSVNYRKLLAR